MSLRAFELPTARCGFRHQFWKDNHWDVNWVEGTPGNPFLEKFTDLIIVDPLESSEVLHQLKQNPQDVGRLHFVDSVWLESGRYWPRNFYEEVLRELIVRIGQRLDIAAVAYVAGTGPWARLAAVAAFELGYRRVSLISNDSPKSQQDIQRLSSFCFGLEIEILATAEMTLKPNNGSLLINTLDLQADRDMLETLLYLNFIHRPGLIVDIPFTFQLSALMQEGRGAGFDVVSGVDIRGLYDYLILRRLGVEVKLEWSAYVAAWRAFLDLLR
ncbi:MAG: hypothetical protein C5B49_00455 [Bdellovibrio sp.]|nr:MAG: hypothetical protein C5B49_00455 [Bdellovibrio sp.]